MLTGRIGIATAVALFAAVAACGDDNQVTSFDPSNPSTTLPGTTAQESSSGGPTSTDPTSPTSSPTDPSAGTLATEGGSTTDASTSTTAGTTGGPGTTGDVSGGSTTDVGSTGDASTGGSSTGVVPCDDAMCPQGQYCNQMSNACEPGCNEDSDCQNQTKCDIITNTCKGCISDSDCMLGTVCSPMGECVAGCSDKQPCQDGLACCTEQCFDLLVDLNNCGGCGVPCKALPNANPLCTGGMCKLGTCKMGWNDCDKDPNNGCEYPGTCKCTPGATAPCYTGPDGTAGVGICKQGTQTCNQQGTGYGACVGEVLPNDIDICANNLDDNCNGVKDEDLDEDGDGYTVCKGDCCDSVGPNCLNPNLVNAGAFEVMGNMVDDDCDGVKDNPVPSCDAALPSNSADPLQYAKAIDLCQFTTENAVGKDKKWGVISGTLTRADGAGAINASAKSIRTGFGTTVLPQQNASLAVLSTGAAADLNDVNPAYVDFQTGWDNAANSAAPADWLAANGNVFPNAPGCPAAAGNTANNSAMLKLRVRVPTNAKSFNVQMYFYSSEWPEWTCTAYNDMFVTLVNSAAAGNPTDKNIAIYTVNNTKYPVGVNLVKAAPGLFTQCKNGTFGCSGVNGGTYNGCTGTGGLTGTGFDIVEGGCGTNNTTGGGTGWLKMSGNVKGGETFEIRFAIWDTSDGIYDSLVLLDDFVWSVQASQPGVQPN